MDSVALIIVLIVALIAGMAVVLWQVRHGQRQGQNDAGIALVNQNVQSIQQSLIASLQGVQQQLQTLQQSSAQNIQGFQGSLNQVQQAMHERLQAASVTFAEVKEKLGQMHEIGKGMRELQDFLKSPKLRGNIGEQVLRDLLEQTFPHGYFELQYTFISGERVDAILKTSRGMIPIDSKFPMENFTRLLKAEDDAGKELAKRDFVRDFKKHVEAISKKYILPQEGTVDFAVMYVPSESVYAHIMLESPDVLAFAQEKKIFIVSPNSFYYFLKIIMVGLEGKRIEAAAQQIMTALQAISQDTVNFGRQLEILTTHVTNAKGALDKTNIEYGKLSGKIDQVRSLRGTDVPEQLPPA